MATHAALLRPDHPQARDDEDNERKRREQHRARSVEPGQGHVKAAARGGHLVDAQVFHAAQMGKRIPEQQAERVQGPVPRR